MTVVTSTPTAGRLFHRPVATGPAYWGPGDHYTFLVTGEESGGAYFAMEALVPPGGGPPPHIQRDEDETFYLLEGHIEFRLGDETITAGPGDFVNIPRGTVHSLPTQAPRLPDGPHVHTGGHRAVVRGDAGAGPNDAVDAPDNVDEVAARYVAASARYGLEFV